MNRGAPEKDHFGLAIAWMVQLLRWKGMTYPDAVTRVSESIGGCTKERTVKRHYGKWKDEIEKYFTESGVDMVAFYSFLATCISACVQEIKASKRLIAKELRDEGITNYGEARNVVKRHIDRRTAIARALMSTGDTLENGKVK